MKKAIAFLLVILSLLLCACGGSSSPASSSQGGSSAKSDSGAKSGSSAKSDSPAKTDGANAPADTVYPYDSGLTVTLEKVSGFPADAFPTDFYGFQDSLIVTGSTRDGYSILNAVGEDLSGEVYSDYEQYSGYEDYVFVAQYERFPNTMGLCTAQGEVLIPCEAAKIRPAGESGRFVEVMYATDEVEDEDEAYLYATSKLVSLAPDEGEKLYAGYSLVYDLQTRSFVDGIRIEDTKESMEVIGDSIYLNKAQKLYAADGTCLSDERLYSRDPYLFESEDDNGRYSVYNDRMELVCSVPFNLSDIFGEAEVFSATASSLKRGDGNLEYLVDREGNLLNETALKYTTGQYGRFIAGKAEDGSVAVFDLQGNLVVSPEFGYESCFDQGLGFVHLEKDGRLDLLFPNGSIVPVDNISKIYSSSFGLGFVTKEKNAFILDLGAFTDPFHGADAIGDLPVFIVENENGDCALLNGVNGEMLIAFGKYERIECSGSYVYCLGEKGWEAYTLTLTQKGA